MLQLKRLEMVIGIFFHGHCLVKPECLLSLSMEKEGSLSLGECKKRADDLDRAEAWDIFFLNQSRKDYLEFRCFICNFKIALHA